ncbi:MAG: hypothetical protein JNM43_09635 [Planctomycetaceae bacterium]|nr:hypothetical protein [Planctomycetaceae bacterium]
MFGWFKPQCPVDPAAKQWIEDRLHWLSKQFGRDIFTRRAMILPTSEFFPEQLDGTAEAVRRLLDQVCDYMDVSPDRVELDFFTNRNQLGLVNDAGKALPSGAAGLYEDQGDRRVIHLETNELSNLEAVIGTIAHELSHLRLMGEDRVSGDEFDNELLTDLTATFFGFGLFLGNHPRNWEGSYSKWPGTQLQCPEYMSLPMYAWVLCHSAWWRGQEKPEWTKYMSYDLRASFRQGMRYLRKTGDSKFAPPARRG